MRGGDRGLREKEDLGWVDSGKWAAVRQGGNRRKWKIFED
jgi:hypothetical protein